MTKNILESFFFKLKIFFWHQREAPCQWLGQKNVLNKSYIFWCPCPIEPVSIHPIWTMKQWHQFFFQQNIPFFLLNWHTRHHLCWPNAFAIPSVNFNTKNSVFPPQKLPKHPKSRYPPSEIETFGGLHFTLWTNFSHHFIPKILLYFLILVQYFEIAQKKIFWHFFQKSWKMSFFTNYFLMQKTYGKTFFLKFCIKNTISNFFPSFPMVFNRF